MENGRKRGNIFSDYQGARLVYVGPILWLTPHTTHTTQMYNQKFLYIHALFDFLFGGRFFCSFFYSAPTEVRNIVYFMRGVRTATRHNMPQSMPYHAISSYLLPSILEIKNLTKWSVAMMKSVCDAHAKNLRAPLNDFNRWCYF